MTRLIAEGDVTARVDVIQPLGSDVLVVLELPGSADEASLTAVVPPETSLEVNQTISLRLDREHLHLFDRDGIRRLNGLDRRHQGDLNFCSGIDSG